MRGVVLVLASWCSEEASPMTGTEIVTIWNDLIGDRWAVEDKGEQRRVSWGGEYQPVLDFGMAIMLVKGSAASIKRAYGASCTLYAQVVHGDILKHVNQNGGGRWAEGHISAVSINGHRRHMVNWVILADPMQSIWILDAPFSSNPALTRWVYQIQPEDTGFYHMVM